MNGMRMPMQNGPRGAGFGQMPGMRGVRPMNMPMNGMYQPGMIRPMMAPAGVRQPFGVNPNSPYKFNQQVRNAPQQQQQHQNQNQQMQHQDVNQLANQFQNQAQISNQQQMQQQQQNQQQMPQQNA